MKCNRACYILITVMVCASSCINKRSQRCEIYVKTATEAVDSISLYCYESDYNRSRKIFSGRLSNGWTLISDNINSDIARVAYFMCGYDSIPHYFVLEPGKVSISILKDKVIINGSGSNFELFQFRNRVKRIDESRLRLRDDYLNCIRDSVLTQDTESKMFKADSILADSLQRIIVNFVNRGDAASQIAKEQYSERLTSDSWQLIK